MIKLADILNEMYPPYKADMLQKVRHKASDTFTNDPKVATKSGYAESSDDPAKPTIPRKITMIKLSDILKEAQMSPVKKVINSVFKRNGIQTYSTSSTGVRGFTSSSGTGYKYEQPGLVMFRNIPKDVVENLAAQMKEAGVIVHLVHERGIEFDPYKLQSGD